MTSIIHDIPASAGPMLAAGAVLLPTTAGLRLDGTTLEIWSDDAPIEARVELVLASSCKLSYLAGAMQNPTARPELQLTFTQAHADALDAAAKRLAPELAAWNGGDIQDVELEMCVESVAVLGFSPDAEEACYAAQDSFNDSMRHALRNLWSELSDEARAHLLKIERGSRDSEP